MLNQTRTYIPNIIVILFRSQGKLLLYIFFFFFLLLRIRGGVGGWGYFVPGSHTIACWNLGLGAHLWCDWQTENV